MLARMQIFRFFILGSAPPICYDSKTVSNFSVVCSSAELQSVHTRFWLLCLHACIHFDILLLDLHLLFAINPELYLTCLKLVPVWSYIVHTLGFGFCPCMHAYIYIFYGWIFFSYLHQFQNCIKLVYSLFQ